MTSISVGSRKSICWRTKTTFLSQVFCKKSRNSQFDCVHGLATEKTNRTMSARGMKSSATIWCSFTIVFRSEPGFLQKIQKFPVRLRPWISNRENKQDDVGTGHEILRDHLVLFHHRVQIGARFSAKNPEIPSSIASMD